MISDVEIGITHKRVSSAHGRAELQARALEAMRAWVGMFDGRSYEFGASVGGAFTASLHVSRADDVALALRELDRELGSVAMTRSITQRSTRPRVGDGGKAIAARLEWRNWITRPLVGRR